MASPQHQTPERPVRQRLFFSSTDSSVPESPVPLSQEEAANAEVRALAAKLTPAFVEADAFLASHGLDDDDDNETMRRSVDDDDGIVEEEEDLLKSEDALRHELEMAQDFGRFFQQEEEEQRLPEKTDLAEQSLLHVGESSPIRAEADIDQNEDATPEKNTPLPPIRLPSTPSRKYSKDRSPTTPFHWTSPSGIQYSPDDHMEAVHLRREPGSLYYSVNMTRFLMPKSQAPMVKEYCLAIPEAKLRRQFVGLLESAPAKLPVRTISIRLRGDVLCGSIMEAVHHALTADAEGSLRAAVRKRQGGHIRACVPGCVVASNHMTAAEEQHWAVMAAMQEEGLSYLPDEKDLAIQYPPFVADLQVVTLKSEESNPACERCLLIRVYHIDPEDVTRGSVGEGNPTLELTSMSSSEGVNVADPVPTEASRSLRESAALVQFIESPDTVRRKIMRNFQSTNVRNIPNMREKVQEYLLSNYVACPSVKDGGITLPALNSKDFPIIQSSWRLVQNVWDELETRGLAFSTLRETRFGAFPALPTLDVHYVSQLRRLSRDFMVVQLLKSATQLEEYAREAEYACANMISLLKPTFEVYGISEPSLPRPVPLTSYPLDFTAPQTSCPPWGQKVQTALNEVQSWLAPGQPASAVILDDQEALKSAELSEKSVQCVFAAFQRQDDEEQNARLGRKNVQVMDRLAKMQAHQQKSIEMLEKASSDSATKAADDFAARAGSLPEVPLLKWKILVGGSTGSCTITAHHIMFVTQLIPVIGGNKVAVFALSEVDFVLREETPSMLNPLSSVIAVRKDGEEVYSFRPSMGGSRLTMFLSLLQKTTLENPLFVPSPR